MSDMTVGIFVDPNDDEVSLKFHDIGNEIDQHKLAQYLHPKLLSVKQLIPSMEISVIVNDTQDLFVKFTPVGDWGQRLKFEQFLRNWLSRAMKDFGDQE